MSKKGFNKQQIDKIIELHLKGISSRKICDELDIPRSRKSSVNRLLEKWRGGKVVHSGESSYLEKMIPRVLCIDLEISPSKFMGWSMFNAFYSVDQIDTEWFIMSYTAKWLGSDEVFYGDLRGKVEEEDDTQLLQELWALMDQADIVTGQNQRKFDIKKLNARMIMKGIDRPYSPVKTEDTLDIAKRKFAFTSNKLEWLTKHLNVKYKKLDHGKFAGFKLWKECLAENPEAWDEMKEYNIHDVLSTEELWLKIRAWDDKSVNFALYLDDSDMMCACGSKDLSKDGYAYTSVSKFQQYRCNGCGKFMRGRKNLFSKEKRASLLMNVTNK